MEALGETAKPSALVNAIAEQLGRLFVGKTAYAPAKQLFVNWIGYHGRSDDLAKSVEASVIYITGGTGNRLLRYIRQWFETTNIIKRERPQTVFVMQPPVMALWASRWAAPKGARIVVDLHTGVFTDPKWKWAWKGILRSQRRRGDAAIVTNEYLAATCRQYGVKTFVLDDAVPRRVGEQTAPVDDTRLELLVPDEYVLVPLAYAADEPLDEILHAAKADAARTWVFTGRAPASIRQKAPSNVVFSGFVSRAGYDWLAANAGAILATTTEEDTMQRAGYEAVSWERPLVTTRSRVLVEYFGDSAVFADPTSASLLSAVREGFARREELIDSIVTLGERKRDEYDDAIESVRAYVNGQDGAR